MTPYAASAKLPRRPALTFVLAGLALALAIGLSGSFQLAPCTRLDRAILDTLQVHTASGRQAANTVVVDVDDRSLAAVGQWPWPRYRLAALIDRIAAEQPSAIALDIMLPEPDRVSLTEIQQTFKRDFDVDLSFNGVPAALRDNDGYLGQQMARAGVVGARYFYFDHATRDDRPLRPGIGFDGRVDLLSLDRASGVLENVEAIARQTRVNGFVNVRADNDGVLRRLPLLIEYHGVVHASLALAATMHALGVSSARVESGRDGLSLRIGQREVPIDPSGYALLRFNGPSHRYPSISAVDVLAGRARAQDLRGKIVFIGSTAAGLNDLHRTAVDRLFPGLKIQSALTQDILDGDIVRVPVWGAMAALIAGMLLAALLCGLFVAGCSLAMLASVGLSAALVLLALATATFLHASLFLPVAAPLLVLGMVTALCVVVRAALHQRRERHWRKQLENARQVTIESMSAVAETRDPETGAHIKRTQHYVRAIARRLKGTGHYVDVLTEEYIHLLFLSAPLHDIGKVGVPDNILLKPGRLTEDEWVVMRKHPEFGRQIILSTAQQIEGDNFLAIAADIAATHHEKWDGTGYPAGLLGASIPLSGRIMAVADIYDALISRRCYKEPFSHEVSTTMMREMGGTTFDPVVLDAFFEIEDEIRRIAGCFRDEDEDEDESDSPPARSSDSVVAPAETSV
ncbi:CHASE2 domain-containing protein [Trinickia sp.]|uniref:CHASE2 domain-containing protein n=1 Tax=Trinickia sp. TaxID=2571163 RepID=UPI003F81FD29